MDILWPSGVEWIILIQSLGDWLRAPMQFFTSLGYEDFYMLILPLLYWSVDASLGLRVGFILLVSSAANDIFKVAFTGPRPYWVNASVKALSTESSFGVPSGHAQNAVAVWGIMAGYLKKRWAWVIAILLIFLIGFSRMYLGVHFPHDVAVGWLIGIIILLLFLRFWDPLAARIKRMSLSRQILLAFAVSMIFVLIGAGFVSALSDYQVPADWAANALLAGTAAIDPLSLVGLLTTGGTLFGMAIGAAWIMSMGGFQADGPIWKRALRYVVGLIGVVILWMGLGAVFPREADILSFTLRYLRYTLVGFWVTGGAPWLFFRFRLSERP